VSLTGKIGTFAGRMPVDTQKRRQPREEREAALLFDGLASMIIAATGYTSTREARTPERNTGMQSIGSIANREFG
jgi:hypothetical protein